MMVKNILEYALSLPDVHEAIVSGCEPLTCVEVAELVFEALHNETDLIVLAKISRQLTDENVEVITQEIADRTDWHTGCAEYISASRI